MKPSMTVDNDNVCKDRKHLQLYTGQKCGNHLVLFSMTFSGLENLSFKFHDFPGSVRTRFRHRNCICQHTRPQTHHNHYHHYHHHHHCHPNTWHLDSSSSSYTDWQFSCKQTNQVSTLYNYEHITTTARSLWGMQRTGIEYNRNWSRKDGTDMTAAQTSWLVEYDWQHTDDEPQGMISGHSDTRNAMNEQRNDIRSQCTVSDIRNAMNEQRNDIRSQWHEECNERAKEWHQVTMYSEWQEECNEWVKEWYQVTMTQGMQRMSKGMISGHNVQWMTRGMTSDHNNVPQMI